MASFCFTRLPPATALVVLAAVLTRSYRVDALHAPPRATTTTIATLPHHALDVVPWPFEPPMPTPAPTPPGGRDRDVLRRQDFNTICGFLGGNKDLPATCGGSSHCVLAPKQGAIGCCPDVGPCTTGVFTGCVDHNSPPQTELDPYVYTCSGANVCYRNMFDGGFSQFGCGTASNMATSVRTAIGSAALPLTSVSVPFTASAETLPTPTTIGRPTVSSSRSPSSSSSPTTSSSSTTPSSTTSSSTSFSSTSSASSTGTSTFATSSSTATSSPTSAPAADGSANGADKSVAIIGGVISGVAILVAVFVVAFTVCRRRRGNERDGPGNSILVGPTYVPPTSGHGFSPVESHEPRFESHHAPPMAMRYDDIPEYGAPGGGGGPITAVPGAAYGSPYQDDHFPPQPGAVGGSGRFEGDRAPLNRAGAGTTADAEMEEFRQGYREAIDRIEQDDEPMSPSRATHERPLWQQNRRLSRSLMWI